MQSGGDKSNDVVNVEDMESVREGGIVQGAEVPFRVMILQAENCLVLW